MATMTKKEVCEAIIKLNDGTHTQSMMAEMLGRDRGTINKYIKEMERQGLMEYKEPARVYHPSKRRELEREVKRAIIKDLIIKGFNIRQISGQVNMRRDTISAVVKEMVASGEIAEVKTLREYNKRSKKIVSPDKRIKGRMAATTLKSGETIKCTPSIAKTCVYGAENGEAGWCRYSRVTDKPRSSICPYNACTVYSKISKDNKRLPAMGEETNGEG